MQRQKVAWTGLEHIAGNTFGITRAAAVQGEHGSLQMSPAPLWPPAAPENPCRFAGVIARPFYSMATTAYAR
jgi:hypothetical protein